MGCLRLGRNATNDWPVVWLYHMPGWPTVMEVDQSIAP